MSVPRLKVGDCVRVIPPTKTPHISVNPPRGVGFVIEVDYHDDPLRYLVRFPFWEHGGGYDGDRWWCTDEMLELVEG